MLIATKKNRQLRIPDSKQKEYENMGYTITNPDGSLVSQPVNTEKENAALKAENAALKDELAALKAAMQAAATSEDEVNAVANNEAEATAQEETEEEAEVKATAKKTAKKKTAATGE